MKKIMIGLLSLLLLTCSYKPLYESDQLSKGISLSEFDLYYSIMPLCYEMERALIFYPGGLVEPDSYFPFAYKMAEELNIAVFIQKMPLNLAVLGQGRTTTIIQEYDYLDKWYIGGHSLGGVMAASFVKKNPEIFDALLLLASYPMKYQSLRGISIPVLSISGSEDGIVDKEKYKISEELLPSGTIFLEIDGANHSQFGSYGKQRGDNNPKIREEEQQMKIIDEFRILLENN